MLVDRPADRASSAMRSWLTVIPMTRVSANALDEGDLAGGGGHRHHREVAEHPALGGVLDDDAGGPAAAQDVGRGQVGRVAERALALDDDDVGVLALEGRDHLVLDLAGAELRHQGVERDAVLAALDDRGLAGADQDGVDAAGVERLDEQGGGGALADGAVGAEHGDARAGHVEDAAREEVEVLLGLRAAHVGDGHAGSSAAATNSASSLRNSWSPLMTCMPVRDAVEQHHALRGRQQPVGRRQAADEVVRDVAGVGDGLGQARQHGDAVGHAVEHGPGVGAGMPAVDDAQDLVLLGVPDQSVGGLAVLLAELALAVDDGRWTPPGRDGKAAGTGDDTGTSCSSEGSEEATGSSPDRAVRQRTRRLP